MAQQLRAQLTRDRALEGAARVFARTGYSGASLSEIIQETGLSKGALYFHFTSKEEIARAIMERERAIVAEALSGTVARSTSALEASMGLSADFARLMSSDAIVVAGIRLTTDTSTFDPPLRGAFDDWFLPIEQLLRRAVVEGDVRDDVDPATIAHFVVPAFTGVQLFSGVTTGYADLVPRVREMWFIMLPYMVRPERLEAAASTVNRVLSEAGQ